MSAEKQYTDFYRQSEATVREYAPECMNRMRSRAFADLERNGFPSLQQEDYRYTDVNNIFSPEYGLNLHRIAAPVNPSDIFRCEVPNMSTSLYFVVNDSFYSGSLPAAKLPEGVYAGGMKMFMERYPETATRYYGKVAKTSEDAITALNTMFAQDGFVLYVPSGVKVKRMIQLVNTYRSTVDILTNRRVLIILEPYSEAKLLVCDHSLDKVKCLTTQVIEIFAEEGSCFDYYDLEESSVTTTRFSSLYAIQGAHSNVLINGITLNNGLTRNNYHININGEGAETTLCGLAVQDRNQHVDTYTHITHAVPRCKSKELFKSILDDQSTHVFSGRILVKEGAAKTEAFQTNRNMCLTRQARVYSKPQLEIYTDDVRCSHGMTTGELDEQALFYMQSRGIPRDEAKTLLSVAFTSDVIDNVRLDPLKDRLRYLIERRFRGEPARCDTCHICNI